MNLVSKSIRLRLVEPTDAEFILGLRTDVELNQYLSSVGTDVSSQIEWIKNYKILEAKGEQFYFVIERLDGVRCGTVRVYDLHPDSFCWGSWILNSDKTRYAALESAFLVYDFGFRILGFAKSHFQVMKDNARVVSFHSKMGAKIVREDLDSFYFEITKEVVEDKRSNLIGKLK